MSEEIQISEDNRTNSSAVNNIGWLLSCAVITVVATFLRFYMLALKPLHHDEGVNGFFLTNLFRDGVYKYDPANYHGPTLYYISLAFTKVFGLETIPIRASVAIFGVLIVFFLIKEPHGIARLWSTAKEKLRLWPFPH